jgi:hypothetical protein
MIRQILQVLITVFLFATAHGVNAQSDHPFVDESFEVPEGLVTEDFRLRMLSVNDVVKDFEAVMASKANLLRLFPGGSDWPEGLTLEANLVDLGWHQKEFQIRRSFTYTVVSPDGTKVLGCVYIHPTRKRGYNADITFWARESDQGDPADRALEKAVRTWIAAEWPFASPAYPGRDISWDDWRALETLKR